MKVLFQNPKAALAYVGFTLVGVVMFVGTEETPGSLNQTVNTFSGGKSASDIAAQRKFGDPMPGDEPEVGQSVGETSVAEAPVADESAEPENIEFATDEDLIDDASGFNPNPSDDFSGFDPNPSAERPFLSDQDKNNSSDEFGGWATEPED